MKALSEGRGSEAMSDGSLSSFIPYPSLRASVPACLRASPRLRLTLWLWKSESSVCPTSARAPSLTRSPRPGRWRRIIRLRRSSRTSASCAVPDERLEDDQPVHQDREDHPGGAARRRHRRHRPRAPAPAKGWATSSSRTSARSMRSCTSCAASKAATSRTSKARVDPIRDIDTIDTELALADLETVSSSLDKAERSPAAATRTRSPAPRSCETCKTQLNEGKPVRAARIHARRAEARQERSA